MRIMADLASETLKAREAWSNTLQVLKDKDVKLDYSVQQNYLPDLKEKENHFMI